MEYFPFIQMLRTVALNRIRKKYEGSGVESVTVLPTVCRSRGSDRWLFTMMKISFLCRRKCNFYSFEAEI